MGQCPSVNNESSRISLFTLRQFHCFAWINCSVNPYEVERSYAFLSIFSIISILFNIFKANFSFSHKLYRQRGWHWDHPQIRSKRWLWVLFFHFHILTDRWNLLCLKHIKKTLLKIITYKSYKFGSCLKLSYLFGKKCPLGN